MKACYSARLKFESFEMPPAPDNWTRRPSKTSKRGSKWVRPTRARAESPRCSRPSTSKPVVEFWAFQATQRHLSRRRSRTPQWPLNDIDRFVLSEVGRCGAAAGRRRTASEKLIRRLSFDSHRPATDPRGDRCQFVSTTRRPTLTRKLVDRLLQSESDSANDGDAIG